jgi:hypothetical protein
MDVTGAAEAGPLRVLLDSDAFDVLALDDDVLALVETSVASDVLVMLVIDHQAEEVGAPPDGANRRRLMRLTLRATSAVAVGGLDGGRRDMAELATDQAAALLDRVVDGNLRHLEDAALLLTAHRDDIPIVTLDRRLTAQCAMHGIDTVHPDELIAMLRRRRA